MNPSTNSTRRNFFYHSAAFASAIPIFERLHSFAGAADSKFSPTVSQTLGPYYPIPAIEEQPAYDADLTRLDADSPMAQGEVIVVEGAVVDLDGAPLIGSTVEVWQAGANGHYHHPRDDEDIDKNFQFFARIDVDDKGQFRYKTIQPGKYPGRTPHIHYRVLRPLAKSSDRRSELVTQMYFESQKTSNERDGLYMEVTPEQRKALTIEFQPKKENDNLPTGFFQIVLGPESKRPDRRQTPKS